MDCTLCGVDRKVLSNLQNCGENWINKIIDWASRNSFLQLQHNWATGRPVAFTMVGTLNQEVACLFRKLQL